MPYVEIYAPHWGARTQYQFRWSRLLICPPLLEPKLRHGICNPLYSAAMAPLTTCHISQIPDRSHVAAPVHGYRLLWLPNPLSSLGRLDDRYDVPLSIVGHLKVQILTLWPVVEGPTSLIQHAHDIEFPDTGGDLTPKRANSREWGLRSSNKHPT